MAKRNSTDGRTLSSRKKLKGNIANLRKRWATKRIPSNSSTDTLNTNSNTMIPGPSSGMADNITTNVEENVLAGTDDTESQSTSPKFENVEGNRIINISHFFNQLKEISSHGQRFGCTLNNLSIKKEIKLGLISKFLIKCDMCNAQFYLESQKSEEHLREAEENLNFDLNSLAVKGIMSIGSGYYGLEEFLGSIDVPCMAERTYQNRHEIVATGWQLVAEKEMKSAADEEIRYAIETGSIDKTGVPLVQVVVDGAWSKRSYKTKYDALSGVAAIVGHHTGKILYIGVRNKYCVHCDRKSVNNLNAIPHVCSKNYTGSSTSMEAHILVQGFKSSMDMYGVKYHRMIGDGDSSVYNKILEARPYSDITVEKIECRNHLFRNYSTKLKNLVSLTTFSCNERKLLESRLLRLRTGVKSAIKHHKKTSDKNEALKNLRTDILNGVNHVFGDHKSCSDYFCKKPDEENLMKKLSQPFVIKIMEILRRLANHSRSLLLDVDSNVVEHYNAKVAKFIGGKRINYALKNSYGARCAAAVVSHNSITAHTTFKKALLLPASHGKIIRRIEIRKKSKNVKRQIIRQTKKHYKTIRNEVQDKDYGEDCQKADIEPIIYEEAEKEFINSLKRTNEEREDLEIQTRYQSQCGKWMEERRKLLTASNFGKVCKRKMNKDSSKMVKSILYKTANLTNVPSIRHGHEMEENAKTALEEKVGFEIRRCGLFIDKECQYLGASPDGVSEENIIEVKCPYTAFKQKLTVEEAIMQKKITLWRKKGNTIELNKNHDWYYQIQGQLHVTNRKTCILGVWTGYGEIKIAYIERDDKFWKEKMEKKLKDFYFKCLLPELIDPRHARNLPLRTIIL